MLVGLSLSICGEGRIGVLEDVVFQILHRAFAPNKKKRVAVVQHTHFIRGHQLPSGSLKVGGVASAAAFGLAVGVGVNSLFPQQLGHILVGGLLIADKIQKSVAIFCLFFCSTKTQKVFLRFGRCVSFGLAP